MQIGIGLPASIPEVTPGILFGWARLADEGPFSSLGVIDRVVYANYEPLTTLAAVAGITRRIRLLTNVLVAPLRNTGILAKEAATLDALSGGRFTLGLGVGAREDDYAAAPAAFHNRGKRFEEQLVTMKRIWAGETLDEHSNSTSLIGPKAARPGGPEVLIGGYSPMAIRRVGNFGDGLIIGSSTNAEVASQFYAVAQQSWQEQGRSGKPRFVGCKYFALGLNAAEKAGAFIRHYYSFMESRADALASSIPTTPEAVKEVIQSFVDTGMDELVLWPCIADIEQINRLLDLI
jgi:alkanesulfonate monooxygenase SsuD/methylene tetrahydromethanopterin reductase-like flavin-dependent oxidoreductase (luciferase family)